MTKMIKVEIVDLGGKADSSLNLEDNRDEEQQ